MSSFIISLLPTERRYCFERKLSSSITAFIDIILEPLVGNIHFAKSCENLIGAGVVILGDMLLKLGNKCLCFGRNGTRTAVLTRGKPGKDRN